jgi:hypothetical protein
MKTKIFLSFAVVCSLISAAVFFYSAAHSTSKVKVVDYFNGEPAGVFELSAEEPAKNIARFKQSAAKIGVSFPDNQARSTARTVTFIDEKGKDPTRHFEYDADKGYLSFNKGITRQIMDNSAKLPDAKNAQTIARQFLTENQLMPANVAELKVEHVGGIKRMSEADKKEYDVMKTVIFSRTIDGVPVVGEGSRMIVDIGNNGEVMSVSRKWKEVNQKGAKTRTKVTPSEQKTQAEAEAEFKQIIASQFGSNASSKLQTIHKAYFDSGNQFIQPVYLMAATVRFKSLDGEDTEREFIQPISMLKSAPETIMGSLSDLRAAKAKSGIQTLNEGNRNNPPASKAPKR